MNWQTELNSSLSWILTALFWVVLCFSMVMIALKQTTFGQKFWHIASPSINRRNSIKIIVIDVYKRQRLSWESATTGTSNSFAKAFKEREISAISKVRLDVYKRQD